MVARIINVGTFQRDELEKCISGCDGCDGWAFPKFKAASVGLEESQRASFSGQCRQRPWWNHLLGILSTLGIPQEAENKALALELEILHPLTRTAGIVGLQM